MKTISKRLGLAALLTFAALMGARANARQVNGEIRLDNVVVQQVRCQTQTLNFKQRALGTKSLDICFVNNLKEGLVDGLRIDDGHADLRTTLSQLKASKTPVSLIGVPDQEHSPTVFEARTLPKAPLLEIIDIE